MIPRSELRLESADWQNQLKNMVTEPSELCRLLGMDKTQQQAIEKACGSFPLRVPHSYLSRIEHNNLKDPLLLQILPSAKELISPNSFTSDPLQEADSNPVPGIIHKYHGRVLLISTSSCPIHCRYCFRRHFPYEENRNSRQQWQTSLRYIEQNPDIKEVILSGGDPLSCSDSQLEWLCQQLDAIPHLRYLRLHSRFPITIPQRITPQCLEWLSCRRLQVTMVLHCNHPNEINAEVSQSLAAMKSSGITLLNQSVLLKEVNDDIETLAALSEELYHQGVLPYYLHLLDKVQGASHFDVPEGRAIELHQALQAQLPGYLVPKLVREQAGERHKTLIFSE